MTRFDLHHGDALDVLRTLETGSAHALVTDPPAGIGFMGKAWDGDKGGRDAWIAWLAGILAEARRVLKPGAHGLVWALPRTSHWTGMALERAGFEVRDRVTHLFGQGFPKSLDVSKALDRAAGAKRERVRVDASVVRNPKAIRGGHGIDGGDRPWMREAIARGFHEMDGEMPATDLAKQWAGWGTALKPAAEDWWLVRAPFKGSVARNVEAHGVGALNIDGCRIASAAPIAAHHGTGGGAGHTTGAFNDNYKPGDAGSIVNTAGRWPANAVFSHSPGCELVGTKRVRGVQLAAGPVGGYSGSEGTYQKGTGAVHAPSHEADVWRCAPGCAVAALDEQSGESTSVGGSRGAGGRHGRLHPIGAQDITPGFGDTGGASRFFYVAKASTSERTENVEENRHPTVKPLELMRWLVRLVTPRDGLVLDPFTGSGTTGVAALLEGARFVGIERDAEYVELARRRIANALGPLFAGAMSTPKENPQP